jgi:undecaprenyl-diphosphatase
LHNPYFLSVLLGFIEGVTEFLPVSSTAHLRIAEGLLNLSLSDSFWKFYSIVIQLGAILCLPVYFWQRIIGFVRTFPRGERGDRNIFTHPLSLTMIAFVVTAIPAYLLKKQIGKNLENLNVIGAALLIGGAVMWGVDALFTKPSVTHMEEMSLWQAIWIGACQILSAVFPGTSRSMSTIAGGPVAGLSRASALEFSFFLSIPTMMVATLHELKEAIFPKPGTPDALAPLHVDAQGWIILAIGFVVSFFVAWAVVAWFMAWVRRRGFTPFAIYRIILGIAVLIWARNLAAHAS